MTEKTLKVLFVGNSYTFYNDMPHTSFTKAAKAKGYGVSVTEITQGGYRLCQFADPENEHGKRLREVINGQKYDVAVLQEQSLNPITNEEGFLDGVKCLKELIDAERFVLYATWGRNDGSPQLAQLGMTRREMTEGLSKAYNRAAELYGMRVAEVGKAFLEYSSTHSVDELYDPDRSHPSAIGSALAADVILEAVIAD